MRTLLLAGLTAAHLLAATAAAADTLPRKGVLGIGTSAQVRAQARTSGEVPDGPFNPEVAAALASWIGEVMAKPALVAPSAD